MTYYIKKREGSLAEIIEEIKAIPQEETDLCLNANIRFAELSEILIQLPSSIGSLDISFNRLNELSAENLILLYRHSTNYNDPQSML
ncbi:hypothetical protein [Legionella drancourtii]|uniref:Leucine-rich repeat-containing protein n=1 Tax=Legionella drancourtii LLAP12 TaxID=658187 RepID=G9ENT6_9GAMM|nr:hypothetical protein [Legionella drancourtii]EHL31109.1 hypothetical protein LDG_6913 [Legionella drancourtii LLAP12]